MGVRELPTEKKRLATKIIVSSVIVAFVGFAAFLLFAYLTDNEGLGASHKRVGTEALGFIDVPTGWTKPADDEATDPDADFIQETWDSGSFGKVLLARYGLLFRGEAPKTVVATLIDAAGVKDP
ncbi:MAG: hypothetical protein LBJ08_01695, partial [Bifidobacteriaceae bacterium]|nr:hypothetical protein [Bifidobacteriaceae bacterium]